MDIEGIAPKCKFSELLVKYYFREMKTTQG